MERSKPLLDGLLAPTGVTIVGASPNGFVTEHILRNLGNVSCRFPGSVNLVNPRYNRLFDRACYPTVNDVPGGAGLLFLLLPWAKCIDLVESLDQLPEGVVLFPEASDDPARYEQVMADWGRANGVPILGPQSNGLVSTGASLNALAIPMVETLREGGAAFLAQSGGVLGGIVKYLCQKRVGIHSALEYGTGCMLTMEDLALELLAHDDVRMLAIHAEGLGPVARFAEVLDAADRADKPCVFLMSGRSELGRRAAASHSGAAATSSKVLAGVARQFHALSVATVDELVWSIEALAAVDYRRGIGRNLAVFTDSGGAGVSMADALSSSGVALPQPELATEPKDLLNPFDFGSASMGMAAETNQIIEHVGDDPQFGVFAYVSVIGVPVREQSVHLGQLDDFAKTVEGLGHVPFIASLLPFEELQDPDLGVRSAIVGAGTIESAVKLRAITAWDADGVAPGDRSPTASTSGQSPVATRVVTSLDAQAQLKALPLAWPREIVVETHEEIERLTLEYPVMVKSEAGLAHRAKAGGVLGPIDREIDLRHAAAYMHGHFDGPVSVVEAIAHDQEWFVGAHRDGSMLVLLFGPGGGDAERLAEVRLAPLDPSAVDALVRRVTGRDVPELSTLLVSVQDWMLDHVRVETVDLNPVVPCGDELFALDAKVHELGAGPET